MLKEFSIEEYLNKKLEIEKEPKKDKHTSFMSVCEVVEYEFNKEWQETDDDAKNRKLEKEKRAIMGYSDEMKYYKEKIKEILIRKNLSGTWYPDWYPNLIEGIFAELYGLAGLAPWAYDMKEKYKYSSSAKLIGDRLYCMIDGKIELQPQRISKRRREQLKRTLLLATPYERLEYGFHEVYLNNGIRITIYSGRRTKENQDIMVFRKYILPDITLEKIAELGTIPNRALELFYKMIDIGFNVIFTGEVRSGKTSFMQAWQRKENPDLEGIAIATDPETPWHILMPNAPIMQIIADGKELEEITKSILRGDNDYALLEEMRDGTAFKIALDITSIGTKRCKATIHDNDGFNIPYKMGSKISEKYGGNSKEYIAQVFKNFDYAVELCQNPLNRAEKIMKGIVEYSYDIRTDSVYVLEVCKYNFDEGKWYWNKDGGLSKIEKYPEERRKIMNMIKILNELYTEFPLVTEKISPPYYKGNN